MTTRMRPMVGDSAWLVEHTLEALGSWVRRAARRLAKDDDDLADDIHQEAAILLWEMDPSRFDERSRSYVARTLYRRMRRVARAAEHGRDYAPRSESADGDLASDSAPGLRLLPT